jgi:hypothetical protein
VTRNKGGRLRCTWFRAREPGRSRRRQGRIPGSRDGGADLKAAGAKKLADAASISGRGGADVRFVVRLAARLVGRSRAHRGSEERALRQASHGGVAAFFEGGRAGRGNTYRGFGLGRIQTG